MALEELPRRPSLHSRHRGREHALDDPHHLIPFVARDASGSFSISPWRPSCRPLPWPPQTTRALRDCASPSKLPTLVNDGSADMLGARRLVFVVCASRRRARRRQRGQRHGSHYARLALQCCYSQLYLLRRQERGATASCYQMKQLHTFEPSSSAVCALEPQFCLELQLASVLPLH